MRFKSQRQRASALPEINLLPMLDVLMTILTFFVIISMTLTRQQSVDVRLPTASAGTSQEARPDPLIVGLNPQGQIVLDQGNASPAQLTAQVQAYLARNPQGAVILQADGKLPYEQVVQVLGLLREVGGDRVSLAIAAP